MDENTALANCASALQAHPGNYWLRGCLCTLLLNLQDANGTPIHHQLIRLVWTMRGRYSDPDDLVQESLICMFTKAIRMAEQSKWPKARLPTAYWMAVLRRCLLDAKRKERKVSHYTMSPEIIDSLFDSDFSASADMLSRSEVLRNAIGSLSLDDQELLRLYYEQSLSTSNIATKLSLKVETVKKRLQRVRASLRDALLRMGSDNL